MTVIKNNTIVVFSNDDVQTTTTYSLNWYSYNVSDGYIEIIAKGGKIVYQGEII